MSLDRQLQQAVLDELRWEPSIAAGRVGVSANAGVVTLTDHADSYTEKLAAEAAARGVEGVKALVEGITVKLPSDRSHSDEAIAAAAVDRLYRDASVPRDAVKVQVEKGLVTLNGEVQWHLQKDAAEQGIRRLKGIVGVSNRITITPKVDVSNIADDITHALHRSWFFEPQTISVGAEGSRVRLTGTVHTPRERQVAAATAWSATGVTDVENNIAIA